MKDNLMNETSLTTTVMNDQSFHAIIPTTMDDDFATDSHRK